MKYTFLIAFFALFVSFSRTVKLTYTATGEAATIKALSKENLSRRDRLVLIAMTINAEAGGEGEEGQREVFGTINARVKCDKFPNTARGVIYEKGQFDGVGKENFVLIAEIYKRVLKWDKENYIGYLWFFNPDESTDVAFLEWAEGFEYKEVGRHRFFGVCGG